MPIPGRKQIVRRRRCERHLSWALTMMALLVTMAATPAAEASGEGHFVGGVKAGHLAAISHGHAEHYAGGGGFFELQLVPGWLELEASVRLLGNSHLLLLPIDALLKVPFHVSHSVALFVGVGPTAVPAFGDETTVHFGGVVSAGTYLWLSQHNGLLIELDYNLIYEHAVVNELGSNVGYAYRW